MGNGKYTLKAVRRSRNGWSKAGVNDTTAPFLTQEEEHDTVYQILWSVFSKAPASHGSASRAAGCTQS